MQQQLGRNPRCDNRTGHRDSKGWTNNSDSTNIQDSKDYRNIPAIRKSYRTKATSLNRVHIPSRLPIPIHVPSRLVRNPHHNHRGSHPHGRL
jgi:hypothetical protein